MWSIERAREDAAMRRKSKKNIYIFIGIGVEAPLCVKHKISL